MPALELISNLLCPYTQRAAILLAEKGLPCQRRYIDLADKPDWFLRLSPLGKVPVLRVGDAGAIFETSVICAYIEEAHPSPALLPAEPLARARQRAWAELASACIAEVFGFYMAPDAQTFALRRDALAARFAGLERELGDGPWFDGDAFGLTDAAFAPLFRLFDGFDRIEDFGLLAGLPRVAAYRARLAIRDSVREAVPADYGEQFLRYLAGRGSYLASRMAETA